MQATQIRTPAPVPTTAAPPSRHATAASPEVAAVLALQRSVGNRATRAIMRQPTATAPVKAPTVKLSSARGDVVTVEMSDGTRWKVTRKRSTVPIVKKKGSFTPGIGADFSKVWLKVSWCQGTRGEIRIGGNPQGAAADLLKKLAQGIADGGDAPALKTLLEGASITPFLDWDIQRPGDWKITGEVTLTFDKDGLKTAGGKVGVQKGPFEGGIEGSGDREGKWNVTVTGKYTPGGSAKTKGPCPLDELYFPYEYECAHEHDVAPTVKKTPMTAEDKFPEHRFVYFKYASDEINAALTPKDDLKAMEDLMAAGYKVINIQAFTSPEGLRDPSPKWKEGNKELSMRRARKAQSVAGAGEITAPKDVELLPLDFENLDGTKSEGQGKALEDNVISLWESDPDVAEQKTPAAEKRVAAARGRHEKAEVIYEYLRRARIDFEKVVRRDWIEETPVPGHVESERGDCPPDVLQAAKSAWVSTGL
jgi:hypothetical protein